ncbi:MAG: EamA family transporter [Rhizobiaceae bacterium]
MINYILIIAVVSTLAVGQLLFKTVGLRLGERGFLTLLDDRTTLMIFLSSLALYGVATLGWIWALRQVPLSTAYLFMSLGFILVPVISHYALGEPLNYKIALGAILIICGIMVASTA